MKKLLLSMLVCAAIGAQAKDKKEKSDNSIFKKGDKVFTLGVAPVSSLGIPVNVAFDLGVKDNLGPGNLGIGGIVGFAGRKYTFGALDYTVTSIVIAARGTYHYQFVDKLDTYGGVVAGYNAASVKWPSNWVGAKTTYGGPVFGGFVGARYYFTPKFGVMAEAGAGGLGYLNVGLALKL